jgi:meromycolic acid enoyl-[acyl-carrier-protein] reductase
VGLLEGKKVVVTGVLTDASIAFTVARLAQEQGAEIVLTSFGRPMSLTQRVAKRLPTTPDVLELDVSNPEHIPVLTDELDRRWGRLDGMVHSIGFAPESCLGDKFMTAPWEDVATAVQVSAYSLRVLADVAVPLMAKAGGGSIVGLDFDNSTQAFPAYDWMGVAKAALAATSRYLARDLGPQGIRVNLVAAGPIKTIAAKSIPGFSRFEDAWQERSPLGWDAADPEPAARGVVALLSDWFPATTGEVVHVDGGFHAIGA